MEWWRKDNNDFCFYDLCQDIWAGSPATTSLSSGFDSSLVSEDSTIRVEKEKVLIFPNT